MLLYNNRWICLLPFARKPDPRRVSKQVSREPPQAWLFGLVRFGAAGRTKSAAGKPIQRAAGRKNCAIDLLRSPCSSRSVVARAALTEQRLRPLVVHKADRRERAQKLLNKLKASVAFFSFTSPPLREHEGTPRRTPPPKAAGHLLGRPSVALLGRRR